MNAIQRLCSKSILLENGRIKKYEETDLVIAEYLTSKQFLIKQNYLEDIDQHNQDIEVLSAFCSDNMSVTKDLFRITEDIYLNFTYRLKKSNLHFIGGINVHDEYDRNIFDSHDISSLGKSMNLNPGKIYSAQCIIPKNLLSEGVFTISFALFRTDPLSIYNHISEILRFKIIDLIDGTSARGSYTGDFPGIIRPLLNWTTVETGA